MSFQLISKLVTLNDLERCNGRYFALFHRIREEFLVITLLSHWPRLIIKLLVILCDSKLDCSWILRRLTYLRTYLLTYRKARSRSRDWTADWTWRTSSEHFRNCELALQRVKFSSLWSPYGIGQTIIFSSCSFFLSFYLSFFFSSPNLSGRSLPYFHTWCGLSAI